MEPELYKPKKFPLTLMNKYYFLQTLPAFFFFFFFGHRQDLLLKNVFEKQIKKVSGGLEELNSPDD